MRHTPSTHFGRGVFSLSIAFLISPASAPTAPWERMRGWR